MRRSTRGIPEDLKTEEPPSLLRALVQGGRRRRPIIPLPLLRLAFLHEARDYEKGRSSCSHRDKLRPRADFVPARREFIAERRRSGGEINNAMAMAASVRSHYFFEHRSTSAPVVDAVLTHRVAVPAGAEEREERSGVTKFETLPEKRARAREEEAIARLTAPNMYIFGTNSAEWPYVARTRAARIGSRSSSGQRSEDARSGSFFLSRSLLSRRPSLTDLVFLHTSYLSSLYPRLATLLRTCDGNERLNPVSETFTFRGRHATRATGPRCKNIRAITATRTTRDFKDREQLRRGGIIKCHFRLYISGYARITFRDVINYTW